MVQALPAPKVAEHDAPFSLLVTGIGGAGVDLASDVAVGIRR